MADRERIVYSTGIGERCPNCLRAITQCVCRKGTPGKRGDGIVRVSRETQHRNGKAVTVVSGLALNAAELAELASDLKRRCGSGGTVSENRIEIQGEHRDVLIAELARRGIAARRGGG
jgi:translation initiation factor 1